MALEKRYFAVVAQDFTSNGGRYGQITVADASLFKVKQTALLHSTTQPHTKVQINRINSDTEIEVGEINKPISNRLDVSAFLVLESATIEIREQSKPNIPPEEITQAVYEQEPTVAMRSHLVDKLGNQYNSDNPLPVDAQVTVENVEIDSVDLDLSHTTDSIRLGNGTNFYTSTADAAASKVSLDVNLTNEPTVNIDDTVDVAVTNTPNINVANSPTVELWDGTNSITSTA